MNTLEKLLEEQVKTSRGACVLSIDEINAESAAALHAMNSREPGGWTINLPKIFGDDGKIVKRILEQYYIGYGHKSIGDCGPGHVFIDNVSMLCANAFEHWALFSGQETSSRYVDVSQKGFVPSGEDSIDEWSAKWLEFYSGNLDVVVDQLRAENICPEDQNFGVWDKAIKSRACDIMGAFLPSGARTNMSLQMNLRQFSDFLHYLIYHPLPEVRDTAEVVIAALQKTHPNSFEFKKRNEELEAHKEKTAWFIFGGNQKLAKEWEFCSNISNEEMVAFLGEELLQRPQFTELPPDVADLGQIKVRSLIDYRSYRDLHRHRSNRYRMPLVTNVYGFNDWYLEMLPESVRVEAQQLIADFDHFCLDTRIGKESEFDVQYAVPMGYFVQCDCVMNLDAAVYITDLRSGMPVHPTARRWAIQLADELNEHLPSLKLHTCREKDRFVSERGKHDIVKK